MFFAINNSNSAFQLLFPNIFFTLYLPIEQSSHGVNYSNKISTTMECKVPGGLNDPSTRHTVTRQCPGLILYAACVLLIKCARQVRAIRPPTHSVADRVATSSLLATLVGETRSWLDFVVCILYKLLGVRL